MVFVVWALWQQIRVKTFIQFSLTQKAIFRYCFGSFRIFYNFIGTGKSNYECSWTCNRHWKTLGDLNWVCALAVLKEREKDSCVKYCNYDHLFQTFRNIFDFHITYQVIKTEAYIFTLIIQSTARTFTIGGKKVATKLCTTWFLLTFITKHCYQFTWSFLLFCCCCYFNFPTSNFKWFYFLLWLVLWYMSCFFVVFFHKSLQLLFSFFLWHTIDGRKH